MHPQTPTVETRLAAVKGLNILDTPRETGFDDLARLAAWSCDAPIAMINFLDRDRQWFKAEYGLGIRETPLDIAICPATVEQNDLLVIPDLVLDSRFSHLPFVSHDPKLRFYAGAPVRSPGGIPVGTVCVLDWEPRPQGLDARQRETLLALARSTRDQLALRGMNQLLASTERRYLADLEDTAFFGCPAWGGVLDRTERERIRAGEALKQDLAQALDRGQLRVLYQPQIDLRTGGVVGFEALLHWMHPDRGSVPPAEFIPLAEESGLIHHIGDWVLREACQRALSWPEAISISVNLSAEQFRNPALPLKILDALGRTGLKPSRLTLEITESVLLDDSEQNLHLLQGMRDIGARISLDDFGTGYSSLSYLKAFRFDELKIDRSFVAAIGTSRQSAAILRTVLDLARALDISLVAEGVETPEQQNWLISAGYHLAQGFLFSKPLERADADLAAIHSDRLAN